MKKIIYSLLSGFAFAVLFSACDDVNDQFDGLDAQTNITNVAAYNYKLVDADYKTISDAAVKAVTTPAAIALAQSINTNKYFTTAVPASNYVSYLLKTKYPYGDLGSTAMITYSFGEDRPTYLSDLTTVNILTNADYQSAWGGGSYVSAFTPAVSPTAKIPAILAAKFPTATTGQYKFVEYNYSSTEAVSQSTEIKYLFEDWTTHTYLPSPYATISDNGWLSTDLVGTNRNWQNRLYSNNYYAQVSSNGSNEINDLWMISKEIDLTTAIAPNFTFNINVGYWNANCLKVLISENYNGTILGISTATWTDISSNFTLPETPTSSYGVLAPAGTANFTSYKGKKVRIAFRYEGDGRSGFPLKTTTYQVDDIKVSEVKVALSIPSSEKQYVAYMFNGSAWVPAANTFVALQNADYTLMGLSFLSSTNAPLYLPNLLRQKFPFGLEGDVKNVVYKSSSTNTFSAATQFTFTKGVWVSNSFIIEKTEQFVYSNIGWVFDPTIKITMGNADYQLMVDYVLAKPSIAIFAHPFYKNEEYYYGFASRYNNVSFRLSYRNPYFTGAYVQPVTIDPEFNALTTDAAKVTLMWSRLQEGMKIFLQLKYPNAIPKVSGIDVYYHATTYVYYPTGVSSGNEYHKYIFKCTAAASGTIPPQFEFISKSMGN
jgi:hypothetical protein